MSGLKHTNIASITVIEIMALIILLVWIQNCIKLENRLVRVDESTAEMTAASSLYSFVTGNINKTF